MLRVPLHHHSARRPSCPKHVGGTAVRSTAQRGRPAECLKAHVQTTVRRESISPPGGHGSAPSWSDLVVLVVALAGSALFISQRHRPEVAVPDLMGLSLDEAVTKATAAGVTLLQQGSEQTPVPGDTVVRQSPQAGSTVERGGLVRVTFGSPLPQVRVPDVVGKPQAEAVDALLAAGLQPGALRMDDGSGGTPGTIARQQPAAGSSDAVGGMIDLWIAGGRAVTVPDLTGLTADAAQAAAAAAGLAVRILTESTDEGLPGLVFKQQPAAGGSLPTGTQMVAVVNGAAAGSSDGAPEVPPFYAALAPTVPFPLLFPTVLPVGMSLEQSPTNPRRVVGADGQLGCEIRYIVPSRPEVGLSLLQGNWFERGVDSPTTVDVRGFPASLATVGATVLLTWEEGGIAYGAQSTGLTEADLVAFANGLRPVATVTLPTSTTTP